MVMGNSRFKAAYQKVCKQLEESKQRVESYMDEYGLASRITECAMLENQLLAAELEKIITAGMGYECRNGLRATEEEYWAMVESGTIERNRYYESYYWVPTHDDECQAMVDAAIARNHYDEA